MKVHPSIHFLYLLIHTLGRRGWHESVMVNVQDVVIHYSKEEKIVFSVNEPIMNHGSLHQATLMSN